MNIFPLTNSQKRLWIEWKIKPTSPAYNLNLVFKLTGTLKVEHLKETLNLIIKKHEAFRTYFIEENGEPFQIILSPQDKIFDATPMHWLDISGCSTQEQIKECITHETHKPFDLKVPLLYRFCLIKASTNVYYFIATQHHIISDGISLELFVQELAKLYNNKVTHQKYSRNTANTLSQYLDYANAKSTLEKQTKAIAHWKNLMAGTETSLNFHTVAKPTNNKKSSNLRFMIKPDLLINLQKLASTHHTTVFIVLITAFNILLYRYFNTKNLVVGYAVNIRPKELEQLFGFYVNNIPLKTIIEDNQTFIELLALTNQQRNNDCPYQELSLQEIAKTNRSKSDVDKLAPFNVSFNLVSSPVLGLYSQTQGLHLDDLEVEPVPVDIGESHFDLSFLYAYIDEQLGFSVDYKVDIFESWFIEQIAAHFLVILKAISQDPNQRISHIPLLTQEEQTQAFNKLNGPRIPYPQDKTPTQLFEAEAALFPDRLAIVHNERAVSYKELNEKSNQLAQFLLTQTVSSNTVVAVGLERSVEYIISIIGIMKAGCAYLPIDPNSPDERIKFILKDSNAKIFIARDTMSEKFNGDSETTLFTIHQDWNTLSELPSINPKLSYNIHNPAYTIYTSGSTGVPKGIQISIDSLLNLIFWHKATYLVQSNCRASVVAGTGFDASVWEIWPYLANGATLHIADSEIILDVEKLIDWLTKEKVNISFLPTPVADVFLKKVKYYTFPDLRFVLTGGEQLKTFPPEGLSFKVFNHYGPTENTVITTQTEIVPLNEIKHNISTPSIGNPIANVWLYILDHNQQPVPSGVVGELYIGGVGLAQRYLHPSSLSAQSFIPNPFDSKKSETLYKTGDLVRWKCGELNFIGRIDEQIKLRGFRIELTEIEIQLSKYPLIEQCAVLMRSGTTEANCLVAYFVPRSYVDQIDTNKLQAFLSKSLPDYMIPSLYVSISKMPLTLNGKIDKKTLLALDIKHLDSQNNVSPRTKTEKRLLQIWSKVLNMKNIGIYDNFFALGGHSLLISAVVLSVKESFAIELPFRSFFEKPTIANLAHLIDNANNSIDTGSKTDDADPLLLRKTIILDEDIQVTTKPTAPNLLKNLLITGTTGFLGAFLLADLYHATQAKIYCLIRGASLEEAQKRLQETLSKYDINQQILTSKRVEVILGDLTQPQLGINQQLYNTLLEQIDSIYHCGAHVHHIYGYDVLEAANVFSTIEIIKLATLKKHKHIHYVSAVSAARQNLDEKGFIIEDFLKPDPGQINIRDGYNQTKLVSELLLTTAKERGISVHIYRPAWIGGHSSTGMCALENQHLFLLIKSCIQMGYVPDWNMELNIVPVDFVSRFITLVSTNKHIKEDVFNLVNPKPIQWLGLMNWINNYGYKLSIIPKVEWRRNHLSKITKDNALYPLVPLYIGRETSQHNQRQIQDLKIKNTHTIDASNILGLSCPEIDDGLLRCYLQFLRQTNFIQPPQKSGWYKNLTVSGNA